MAIDLFNHQTANYVSWLRENGVEMSSKWTLADLRSEGRGRGLIAIEDIEQGERLFKVPLSLVLCLSTSKIPIAYLDLIRMPDKKRAEACRNILCLLWERARGEDSTWAPYISTLPIHFDTLMFWTDAEILELQGSYIAEQIGKTDMDELFKNHLVPVIRSCPTDFGFGPTATEDEIVHACHVSGSTFMAYAFDVNAQSRMDEDEVEENIYEDGYNNGFTALVPLADALNADDEHNAQMHFSGEHLIMESIKSVPRGTEILNTYGPLDRAGALRRYGYISDGYKVNDFVPIKASSLINEAMNMYELTGQFVHRWVLKEQDLDLDEADVSKDELATLIEDYDFELEREQVEKLNQTQMDEEFALKKLVPKDKRGRYETMDAPWWMEWLRRAVEAKLGEYQTTLKEDKLLLERDGKNLPARMRMAMDVRTGDKEILEGVTKQMNELLDASTNGTEKKRKRP